MAETAKDTSSATAAPKRDFATWIGIGMLVGMGTLCGAMAAGGLYLAVTTFATKPAAAFGGLVMAGSVGYVMPYISASIRSLFNTGSMNRPDKDKKTARHIELSSRGISR